MNFLDVLIILLVVAFGLIGYWRGFFNSLAGFLSFVLAAFVAFLTYHQVGKFLSGPFGLSLNLAELVTFFLLFVILSILFFLLAIFLAQKIYKGRLYLLDKILGIPAGLLEGIILTCVILILLSVLPQSWGIGKTLQGSKFTSFLTHKTSALYQRVKGEFASKIPGLISYPEQTITIERYGELVSDIDWQELDGATCFACGGKVKYHGLKKHIVDGREVLSPYFVCPSCGRHSDGCQTFEGFHKLYGQCPEELGELGYRFDCGMWPNGNFVKPVGHCPVCHREEVKIPFSLPVFYPNLDSILVRL
jgi:uncharacterized membrane protein required for colicin V production